MPFSFLDKKLEQTLISSNEFIFDSFPEQVKLTMEELQIQVSTDDDPAILKPGDILVSRHSNLDSVSSIIHCLVGN
jgi:hypothetical protein